MVGALTSGKAKTQQASIQYKGAIWCPFPLEFDTYQGCGHQCAYCSARLQRRTAYQRTLHIPRGLETLRKQIEGNTERTAFKMVLEGLAFQWGCAADPFPPLEEKERRSLDALRIFANFGFSFVLGTKSILPGKPEYVREFKKLGERFIYRTSFSTFDDGLAVQLEPGAPLPSDRLDLMRRFTDLGFNTLIRISPFIPEVTTARNSVDEFATLFEKIKECCRYISVRNLLVDLRSTNSLWKPFLKSLGLSWKTWSKLHASRKTKKGYVVFKSTEKWAISLIKNMREAANQVGVLIGFDSGPGTFAPMNTDGPHCCGPFEVNYNPDAVIPMLKDGRINRLDFERKFSLPSTHYYRLKNEISRLVHRAKENREKSNEDLA